MATLAEKAQKYDIIIDQKMQQMFEKYMQLLLFYNSSFNLTAITDVDEIADKHFLDSLLGARFMQNGIALCDIGSGAGFPALPLKIYRKDLKITMMDSLQKRVNFLKEVCTALEIDAQCIHSRAEDAAIGQMRESFDIVTARAVAKLPTLCEYALPLTKVGGKFVAYKGAAEEELLLAQNAIKKLGGANAQTYDFSLPGGDKRSIIIIDKVSTSPKQYPRSGNKPRIAPL